MDAMKKVKPKVIILVIVVAVVAIGGVLFYTNYQDTHFYSTENAEVMADMVTIYPLVTGTLTDWNVKEGDTVKAGQILGRQDTGILVSSSTVNSSALNTTADSIANKADIESPIDGTVIDTSVVKGELLSSSVSAATIADMSNIYIVANVEETSASKIEKGQQVDISIDAYQGKAFTGYVSSIGEATKSVFSLLSNLSSSGSFTKTTQLVPVKITLMGAEGLKLYPGYNATVKIHLQ
jgi:Multidrug resistance efflux pump